MLKLYFEYRLIGKNDLIEATNIEFLDEHRNIIFYCRKKNVMNIK